jgi:hypothetical protein
MFKVNTKLKLPGMHVQYTSCRIKHCPGKQKDNMCAHTIYSTPAICTEINQLEFAEYLYNFSKGNRHG